MIIQSKLIRAALVCAAKKRRSLLPERSSHHAKTY